MDYKSIDQLLEKYWEGVSSLEEEKVLKDYFSSEEVANEHLEFISLFQFYKSEQEVVLPDNFEVRFDNKIKELSQNEKINRNPIRLWIGRAAAIALLIVGSVFIISKTMNLENIQTAENKISKEEKEAAKEAYIKMKAALALVSNKLNKGKVKAVEGISQIRKTSVAFEE